MREAVVISRIYDIKFVNILFLDIESIRRVDDISLNPEQYLDIRKLTHRLFDVCPHSWNFLHLESIELMPWPMISNR